MENKKKIIIIITAVILAISVVFCIHYNKVRSINHEEIPSLEQVESTQQDDNKTNLEDFAEVELNNKDLIETQNNNIKPENFKSKTTNKDVPQQIKSNNVVKGAVDTKNYVDEDDANLLLPREAAAKEVVVDKEYRVRRTGKYIFK